MAMRATVSRFLVDDKILDASGLPWGVTVTPFAPTDERGATPLYGFGGHLLHLRPRCDMRTLWLLRWPRLRHSRPLRPTPGLPRAVIFLHRPRAPRHSCRNSHLLAVSDEEGYISFYDTRRSLPSYSSCWEGAARVFDEVGSPRCINILLFTIAGQARVCNWIAHSNAIFDICWNKIWNAEKRTCTGSLAGHTCSVKAVCSHSSNPDIVVSGSRDGSFALWDLRCSFSSTNRFGETCLSPISLVNDAHALTEERGVGEERLILRASLQFFISKMGSPLPQLEQ